jgi:hypothetical protein
MAAFIYRAMTAAVDQRSCDLTTHCRHLIVRRRREDESTSTPDRIHGFDMSGIFHPRPHTFGKGGAKGEDGFAKPVYAIFIQTKEKLSSNSDS